jgi:hypothetical protein
MKHVFFLLLALTTLALAIDMPSDTEQYYVMQGVFAELEIKSQPCEQRDDVINFACGQFAGDAEAFKEALSDYIRLSLPGLYPATDWFDNAGGIARDYRSTRGQYLFAYNPNGLVVIAFVPRQ